MNENITELMQKMSSAQGSSASQNLSNNISVTSIISGFTPGKLFATIIFSLLGTGYFMYGKRMSQFSFIFAGIALMIFTYFFSNTLYIIIAGILLSILPFYLRSN